MHLLDNSRISQELSRGGDVVVLVGGGSGGPGCGSGGRGGVSVGAGNGSGGAGGSFGSLSGGSGGFSSIADMPLKERNVFFLAVLKLCENYV